MVGVGWAQQGTQIRAAAVLAHLLCRGLESSGLILKLLSRPREKRGVLLDSGSSGRIPFRLWQKQEELFL